MYKIVRAFNQTLSEIERHFNQHSYQDDPESKKENCSDCINYLGVFKQEIYCLSNSISEAKTKDCNLRSLCDLIDSYRVRIIQEDFKHTNQIELISTYKTIIIELKEELSSLNIFKNYGYLSKLNVNPDVTNIKFKFAERSELCIGSSGELVNRDSQEKKRVKNNYQKLNGYRGNKSSVKNYSKNFT